MDSNVRGVLPTIATLSVVFGGASVKITLASVGSVQTCGEIAKFA